MEPPLPKDFIYAPPPPRWVRIGRAVVLWGFLIGVIGRFISAPQGAAFLEWFEEAVLGLIVVALALGSIWVVMMAFCARDAMRRCEQLEKELHWERDRRWQLEETLAARGGVGDGAAPETCEQAGSQLGEARGAGEGPKNL